MSAISIPYLLGLDTEPCEPRRTFHLARFLILRLLGLVYFTGFMILVNQGEALIGSKGILPVEEFVSRVAPRLGGTGAAFARLPSVFWYAHSDGLMTAAAWAGAALSLLVILGLTNAVVMLVLWALYMSFVHIGQDWYGYGWEIQLLETGFLAVFLCPWDSWRPFPRRRPPPVVILLFRWLIFRIMVGAGMIKIRGDQCWRDLTCLYYHYETQPNPNPFSRVLHFEPHWMAKAGCAANHLVELGLPWLLFFGRWATRIAGIGFVLFQVSLIVSGNLSFLNWLTIVPALACFDDAFLQRILPRPFARWTAEAEEGACWRKTFAPASPASAAAAAPAAGLPDTASISIGPAAPAPLPPLPALPLWRERTRMLVLTVLTASILWLSIPVVTNLMSGQQVMNTSFDPLDLVNTYGAFGSVGQERREIVFEGTASNAPSDESAWREYHFNCAPTDTARRPCIISPYHYRLDWQMWFAAMSTPERYPWTLRFTWKLLHNDPVALSLIDGNPFPGAPPKFVRARLYIYKFAPRGSGRWWDRTLLRDWIPPLSVDDARLLRFLNAYGWLDNPDAPAGSP